MKLPKNILEKILRTVQESQTGEKRRGKSYMFTANLPIEKISHHVSRRIASELETGNSSKTL